MIGMDNNQLYFEESQRYWEHDENGMVYHPPNWMPKHLAWRKVKVWSPHPGVTRFEYMQRMKNTKRVTGFIEDIPTEVYRCCHMKWTGTNLTSLVRYVRDYIEHPGKMESEMFTYGRDDWRRLMESDPDAEEKVASGRARYIRSLSSFDRYCHLYNGYDRERLMFDVDDDVECYAGYHRMTPTTIDSILSLCPMWMQMEDMLARW